AGRWWRAISSHEILAAPGVVDGLALARGGGLLPAALRRGDIGSAPRRPADGAWADVVSTILLQWPRTPHQPARARWREGGTPGWDIGRAVAAGNQSHRRRLLAAALDGASG